MLQILVFFSIFLVIRENALTLQDSWNDLQFEMEEVDWMECMINTTTRKTLIKSVPT